MYMICGSRCTSMISYGSRIPIRFECALAGKKVKDSRSSVSLQQRGVLSPLIVVIYFLAVH